MNAFDYYLNPQLINAIDKHNTYIRNGCDKEDFKQEVFAELYDYMPINNEEAIRIINKVAFRFRKAISIIDANDSDIEDENGY